MSFRNIPATCRGIGMLDQLIPCLFRGRQRQAEAKEIKCRRKKAGIERRERSLAHWLIKPEI